MNSIFEKIKETGIIPVVKLEKVSNAEKLADAVLRGGINCMEITFRAEGADKVINAAAKKYPGMLIGAGTVLTTEQAGRAIDSGAKFIVAPGFNPKTALFCQKKGAAFIPGVCTASEIEQALDTGLKYLKFFPAEQAGGLAYIKALSAPYADVRFMPTGGINAQNITDYISFDRVFACGGSWMVAPELLKNEKWDEVSALCGEAVNKVLAARKKR